MRSIKGTETEKNLLKSFAGESQARNRYTYFAKQAKKDGFIAIADMFVEIADQEQAHAKCFFRFLEGGSIEITASYPLGMIGSTLENLIASADGEHEEWSALYPTFENVAREEGFSEVAIAYKSISIAERFHESRIRQYIEEIESGSIFEKDREALWVCKKCGYFHLGKKALKKCPACNHPRAYFEVINDINLINS